MKIIGILMLIKKKKPFIITLSRTQIVLLLFSLNIIGKTRLNFQFILYISTVRVSM